MVRVNAYLNYALERLEENMATLKVYITATGNPCEISTKQFFVYVLKCCDFQVFKYCDKTYSHMPTRCGYLEVEIPPGCYIVGAVMNPNGIPPLGNHLTHIVPIRVNCGEVCVTLFDSSLHVCASWIGAAINSYVGGAGWGGGQQLEANVAGAMRNAAKALGELQRVLPPDPLAAATLALAKPRTPTKAKAKKR